MSTTAPLAPAGHDHEQPRLLGGGDGRLGRRGPEEHGDLLLVAEQDVDVVEQQLEELALVAAHAEGVGQ